jgi:asparagine synthase (glutamine-hydrolysing)
LPAPRFTSGSAEHIYSCIHEGIVSARLATLDRISAYTQVELRHPFLDRRLIDFLLGIPGYLLFKEGNNRYLQREAMRGTLPETIRLRTSKACFTQLYETGLREKEVQKIHVLINDAHIVQHGLIEEQQLKETWNTYWSDEHLLLRPILWMLCIEIWMRNRSK